MTHDTVDIFISGGGLAGLIAAAAFGTAGFTVICSDPTPPVTTRDDAGADLRTTAFLQPSRDLLEDAGVWENLAPYAAPLEVMRIIDAGGPEPEARVTQDFRASDVSDLPFGWNVPNWLIRKVLVDRLASLDTVGFRQGVRTERLLTRSSGARVRLSDGAQIRCKLVIGADGRQSQVRSAAGISVRTQRYGQKALAFAVTHPIPHNNISTEIHRTGGPFTLVPLPDFDGKPSSAVVWMDDGPKTQPRFDMEVPAFEMEMTMRSCGVLGDLSLASHRTIWPIISQQATALTAERTALIAEAAHVMPPIGAQGLNTSLRDVAVLLEQVTAQRDDPGRPEGLAKYARARHADITLRARGIDLLNRASQVDAPLLRDLRAFGLRTLHQVTPVRKGLMRLGLGLN